MRQAISEPASLQAVRRLTHSPQLSEAQLAWGWALLCLALLTLLARRAQPGPALALACGSAVAQNYPITPQQRRWKVASVWEALRHW